ncbi:MAG: response regulator [Pseudomonadota bacterium]
MMAALHSILYVDDNAAPRAAGKLALEGLGHQVRDCRSGQAAVAAAVQFHPDLILLDVAAPYRDAIATLALLRVCPHLAGTPVMFVTAHVSPLAVLGYADADAHADTPGATARTGHRRRTG